MSSRYLKDLNNQFHHGGSISFVELVEGVAEVDEVSNSQQAHFCPVFSGVENGCALRGSICKAWRAYADRAQITSRNSNYHEAFSTWLQQSEYKAWPMRCAWNSASSRCLVTLFDRSFSRS